MPQVIEKKIYRLHIRQTFSAKSSRGRCQWPFLLQRIALSLFLLHHPFYWWYQNKSEVWGLKEESRQVSISLVWLYLATKDPRSVCMCVCGPTNRSVCTAWVANNGQGLGERLFLDHLEGAACTDRGVQAHQRCCLPLSTRPWEDAVDKATLVPSIFSRRSGSTCVEKFAGVSEFVSSFFPHHFIFSSLFLSQHKHWRDGFNGSWLW